jgi:hypothetical protein
MPSSVMLHRAVLLRTDVSKERNVSIIRVTRIGELGTTSAVTSNRRTMQKYILVVLPVFFTLKQNTYRIVVSIMQFTEVTLQLNAS